EEGGGRVHSGIHPTADGWRPAGGPDVRKSPRDREPVRAARAQRRPPKKPRKPPRPDPPLPAPPAPSQPSLGSPKPPYTSLHSWPSGYFSGARPGTHSSPHRAITGVPPSAAWVILSLRT